MKTLKNLALAASIYALTTACGQTNPSPESKVAVTPPTPVTNKCDNVKNPLEDVDWLKEAVKYYKENGTHAKIAQYTYKDKPIYFIEIFEGLKYVAILMNCDKSIEVSCTNQGAGGCGIELFYNFISKTSPNIVIFEQK
jgi:hypothetical protein